MPLADSVHKLVTLLPTLSLGTIRGGTGVNLVPDLVVLEIYRRIVPGESPQEARDEVIRRIATAAPGARIEHDPPFVESAGLPEADAAACAKAIEAAAVWAWAIDPGPKTTLGTPAAAKMLALVP